ncbi:MAG: serine/threonine-protein kinase [Rhodocyclaceae bacterium]|nr:serine/threonine-protein kinase [Rhodocyclaceae bacterium]MDZ4216115.1 serine/threonine-protein kinase [Rhodocyclaceae bacterium]
MTEYIRRCPVCATEAPPEEAQCGHCGTLLQGVDLTLKDMAPPTVPTTAPAPPTTELVCPHADCAMPNPQGSAQCLYCGRALVSAPEKVGAGETASTFYRLPAALASKFRIAEVLPAGGAEAEIMLLEGLSSGVKVIAKLYRPGLMPKAEVLERVSQAAFRHVVHLIAWGESEGVGYEVMEYCAGGSLRQWMTQAMPLRRDQLRDILVEIAEALAALHALQVIHRDLKPENVLVRRTEPLDLVLTDFGIASVADATQLFTSTARTVKYGAPETLAGVLDNAADWWSLGLILVELLTGHHPFEGLSDAVITHRLVTSTLDCSEIDDPEWRKLCRGLLLRDPQRRWGMAEIRRWLAGDESLAAPVEDSPAAIQHAARPYRLEGSLCTTPLELALALATHWESGRKDLMRGQLSAWIGQELRDDDLLRFVQDQLDRRDSADDLRLLRVIRRLAPDLPPVWRGSSLMLAALIASAVRAEQQDVQAAEWLVSVYTQQVLRELPTAQFPAEAALAARWETARARVDSLWREAEAQRTRWQQHSPGVADFDALVFGQPQDLSLPPPAQLHPPLLLALADEAFAQALHAQVQAELAPHAAEAPWLATLLAPDDPAGWIVARLLLPHARKAAAAAQQNLQHRLAAQAAGRAALVSRTNQALAMLRDTCELGLLSGAFQRGAAATASQALLALTEEARAEGLPTDTPLMRTLRRAEPLVLRIQEQLDAWEHAARINAVWQNRNLAQGAVYGLLAFIVLTEILPTRFIFGALLVIAAVVGWRVWGVAEIRAAIRLLSKSLPLRVPTEATMP